ncbi:MAG: hypothetical protein R2816_01830 [Flavobacteriaceae bacterium]
MNDKQEEDQITELHETMRRSEQPKTKSGDFEVSLLILASISS